MAADVTPAVTSGDRRAALEALRDLLAGELDATGEHLTDCVCECGTAAARDGRVVVQLTKELRATIAELDALPVGKGVSSVDEVAERRAARRAANAAAKPLS
jgi:hypothetical protein